MAVAPLERGIDLSTAQDGRTSLAHEALALNELSRLFISSVWYGTGISRGDGSPVVTIPGFMGSDGYLNWLNLWLAKIGYKSFSSGIILNVDPEYHTERLSEKVKNIYQNEKRKVHLVGHSLGGLIARITAHLNPEYVESVTALGSPVSADIGAVEPVVAALAKAIIPVFENPEKLARYKEQLLRPLPFGIRSTCIYTKSDGVVDWRSCIDNDPKARNVEVFGTHCGLAWNPDVYKHVAQTLSANGFR